MIKLQKNYGFKWFLKDHVYVKGYVYDNGKTIKELELCELFKNIFLNKDFNKLKEINGCFSCIVELKDNIFLISDKISSFPLYYSTDGKYISDSVDAIIDMKKEKINMDNNSVVELMASSYVTGEETVYKEIKIVDLGQFVNISKYNIEKKYYFKHIHSYKKEPNYSDIKKEFAERNNKIFENLISSLDGRTVVIPLSGGYDSRYIACMLKKKNYNNVICYTYGDINTYEVQYSKQVAEKLKYKWYFVEYSKEEWEKIFNKKFEKYCEFEHNYISVPHIQDYIALSKLKKQGIINKNCIIVNGFCGDLPAGSFVLNESDRDNINLNIEWITNYIYNQNYNHIKVKKKYTKMIKNKISQHIQKLGIEIKDIKSIDKIIEEWFTGARPCKWVINSNRVYEFFGMEWRMPLWDNEFIEFFYNLDYKYRENCKFYINYLFEELFIKYKVDFKKPDFTNKKTLKYEKSIKKTIKRIILYVLNHIRVITGKTIIKWHDVNNYTTFSLILAKKIINKKIINYHNINAHQMMAIWWCEKKYGAKTIKSIWKGSNKK